MKNDVDLIIEKNSAPENELEAEFSRRRAKLRQAPAPGTGPPTPRPQTLAPHVIAAGVYRSFAWAGPCAPADLSSFRVSPSRFPSVYILLRTPHVRIVRRSACSFSL